MNFIQANSIQDYISIIEKLKINYSFHDERYSKKNLFSPSFIYRGHSNYLNFQLLPGILRNRKDEDGVLRSQYSCLELNVLKDFISEACRFNDIPVNDYPAWLEIAQHFGVPTRLLDFTSNPLVALYFACIDSDNTDGAVWIINERNYRMTFYNEPPVTIEKISKEIISNIIQTEIINFNLEWSSNSVYQYPWIYKPYYREERMVLQSSIFMLWGAKRECFEEFMKNDNWMSNDDSVNNAKEGILFPITIPHDYKKSILKQLELLGITEKFIYPGLDGIGGYIKNKYKWKN